MNITIGISIHCEIEINIIIHVSALFSMCENSYCEMIFIANFISLLFRHHRGLRSSLLEFYLLVFL